MDSRLLGLWARTRKHWVYLLKGREDIEVRGRFGLFGSISQIFGVLLVKNYSIKSPGLWLGYKFVELKKTYK